MFSAVAFDGGELLAAGLDDELFWLGAAEFACCPLLGDDCGEALVGGWAPTGLSFGGALLAVALAIGWLGAVGPLALLFAAGSAGGIAAVVWSVGLAFDGSTVGSERPPLDGLSADTTCRSLAASRAGDSPFDEGGDGAAAVFPLSLVRLLAGLELFAKSFSAILLFAGAVSADGD